MHAKEQVLAPLLRDRLGLALEVPARIDTDRFGTFTGEIPRAGNMREAAVEKARHGMHLLDLALGVASEGSYGAHPNVPFAVAGVELVVLVDDERGLVVCEQVLAEDTNYAHLLVRGDGDELDGFLARIRFPHHAVVVQPGDQPRAGAPLFKGITSRDALARAIARCRAVSANGHARVLTDMRAHCNPTRMQAIRRAGERLAERIGCACPGCGAPGYRVVEVTGGLPCRACGTPGSLASHRVLGCVACARRERRAVEGAREGADPMWCPSCNP